MLISLHSNSDFCVWRDRSRPLPGVLISLQENLGGALLSSGSRPLPGVLISLQKAKDLATTMVAFSSPSRGSYISTGGDVLEKMEVSKFSSPSRGSYISTML